MKSRRQRISIVMLAGVALAFAITAIETVWTHLPPVVPSKDLSVSNEEPAHAMKSGQYQNHETPDHKLLQSLNPFESKDTLHTNCPLHQLVLTDQIIMQRVEKMTGQKCQSHIAQFTMRASVDTVKRKLDERLKKLSYEKQAQIANSKPENRRQKISYVHQLDKSKTVTITLTPDQVPNQNADTITRVLLWHQDHS